MADTQLAASLRPVPEFADLPQRPRGRRLGAIRAAALRFRARFRGQDQVLAVRTVPIGFMPYPAKYALGGAARALSPCIFMVNRMSSCSFATSPTGCGRWSGSRVWATARAVRRSTPSR